MIIVEIIISVALVILFAYWLFRPTIRECLGPPKGLPPPFFLSYVPYPPCENCHKFEPIWDAFVVKHSESFFKKYFVSPNKLPAMTCPAGATCQVKPEHLGYPQYPEIVFVNLENTKDPKIEFHGPYTEEGLENFTKYFIQRHPDRLARLTKFRKENPTAPY